MIFSLDIPVLQWEVPEVVLRDPATPALAGLVTSVQNILAKIIYKLPALLFYHTVFVIEIVFLYVAKVQIQFLVEPIPMFLVEPIPMFLTNKRSPAKCFTILNDKM